MPTKSPTTSPSSETSDQTPTPSSVQPSVENSTSSDALSQERKALQSAIETLAEHLKISPSKVVSVLLDNVDSRANSRKRAPSSTNWKESSQTQQDNPTQNYKAQSLALISSQIDSVTTGIIHCMNSKSFLHKLKAQFLKMELSLLESKYAWTQLSPLDKWKLGSTWLQIANSTLGLIDRTARLYDDRDIVSNLFHRK